MQAGFAFLEAGSVRTKNTTNILLMVVLDGFIGCVSYWAIGYPFAFGEPSNPFIGHGYFFFSRMSEHKLTHFFFQFVFAATACTIVSGALAERVAFEAYIIYSVAITGFIYPVVSHWVWADDGWLLNGPGPEYITFQDFSGSSVVHMVGGIAALVACKILGPRMGRFNEDGSPNDINGHSIPHLTLGALILFFGFLAFNGGSQASISKPGDGVAVSNAVVSTIVAGSFGALVTMLVVKYVFPIKRWSIILIINGGLTGMVAVCACCNTAYAWGAAVIGSLGGLTYLGVANLVLKFCLDDPVDAVGVHLGGGTLGVLMSPLFSADKGLFLHWDAESVLGWLWNALGALAITVWCGVLCTMLFGGLHLANLLRVDPEVEAMGMYRSCIINRPISSSHPR
ncbi:Ammonium transporter 2 [Holothuria leucospilota]|uniref:Ammonium transporter 2 n=1 Tax=Holothuria leucospilota TaxID=206669 RepID=A0A9Q1BFH9_HOLLE|nr:Ammonium transporter 2 [Holothuria leucospilota]